MKKIAIAAVVLAAGVLTAGAVESANTFVTIKATSSTTNTVIAVPLVNIGTGNAALNVTNFVLTTGLEPKATLTVKNTSDNKWYTFVNNNGTWEGGTAIEGDNPPTTPEGTETIARGGAAMLHNEFTGSSFNFYLYGQLATVETTVTPAENAVSAIANASLSDITLSALSAKMSNLQEGDNICIPDRSTPTTLESYTYRQDTEGGNSYKWMKLNSSYAWEDGSSATIPVGTGFWYVSKTSTPPTITWGSQE